MKRIFVAIFILAAVYVGHSSLHRQTEPPANRPGSPATNSKGSVDELRSAFDERRSGVQVTGEGAVSKLLLDDNDGSRHQRFLLMLLSGQTVLVAHNIDLAPRIVSLRKGDSVAFNGVYEWNAKGGVIHWTHHDPDGHHEAGWLKHGGRIYQ